MAWQRRNLETRRLLLRAWKQDDLDPYARICADPEVMRWIGRGEILTRAQCARAIARFEQQWNENGFGLFAAELRDAGRCVGFVGLSLPTFLPEVLPAVEIGWRLAGDAWGRGLATEGAQAVLDLGFDELGLERIVSIHQVGNLASSRIMHKLGMRFERETLDPTCERPVHVYEIARSDWRRARRAKRR